MQATIKLRHILLNKLVEFENCESKDYVSMYYGLTDCLIVGHVLIYFKLKRF